MRGRKILLLQDNFLGHIVSDGLTSIHIENFEPNLTLYIQPEDQGIIRYFKAHYHAKYIERTINCYNNGSTLASIYNIDILEAMHLADAAWWEVNITTIQHCWQYAGILPEFAPGPSLPPPTIPIASLIHSSNVTDLGVVQAESAIDYAFSNFIKRGALQASSQMDIKSLLKPAAEAETFTEVTEEEIFEVVRDTAKANQLDNTDNTDDAEEEELPT